MKEIKITERQKTVLEKIKDFMAENSYPPTVRDIARELGFSSPKAATDHLKSLEKKGFIKRNSLARSIKLTDKAIGVPETGMGQRQNMSQGYYHPGTGSFSSRENAGIIYLPLVGKAAAGNPMLAQENISEYISVSSSLFGAKKADFALKVKGNSMIGDHILDGDIIIARSQNTADNGDIVVALLGDEAVVKRFYRSKDRVELRSSNPEYLPIKISPSDSGNKSVGSPLTGKNLLIQGKVIAVQREI